MNGRLFSILAGLALVLAACSPMAATPDGSPEPPSQSVSTIPAGIDPFASGSTLARVDSQGAVVVEVTAPNLRAPGGDISFEVSMNTHSVDLSMDLAALSTLRTDLGMVVRASRWEAPRGGHHVNGRLIFPAMKDGVSVLDGAGRLTLSIENVDARLRTFEWDLGT
jgi:hypothetical protein